MSLYFSVFTFLLIKTTGHIWFIIIITPKIDQKLLLKGPMDFIRLRPRCLSKQLDHQSIINLLKKQYCSLEISNFKISWKRKMWNHPLCFFFFWNSNSFLVYLNISRFHIRIFSYVHIWLFQKNLVRMFYNGGIFFGNRTFTRYSL